MESCYKLTFGGTLRGRWMPQNRAESRHVVSGVWRSSNRAMSRHVVSGVWRLQNRETSRRAVSGVGAALRREQIFGGRKTSEGELVLFYLLQTHVFTLGRGICVFGGSHKRRGLGGSVGESSP